MRNCAAFVLGAIVMLSSADLYSQQPQASPTPANAPPMYYTLRAPSSLPHHPPMQGVRQGYVRPQMRRPYAYGWFGVPSRTQWVRHFGYRRAYTQWSSR